MLVLGVGFGAGVGNGNGVLDICVLLSKPVVLHNDQ